jgi:hypothetical protein
MLLFGFYFLFVTIMSVIGFFIGLAAEQSYPGSGNIVTVAVFMIALRAAWTLCASSTATGRISPQPEAD